MHSDSSCVPLGSCLLHCHHDVSVLSLGKGKAFLDFVAEGEGRRGAGNGEEEREERLFRKEQGRV